MKVTKGFPGSCGAFESRLSDLTSADLPRGPTPAVWGLTFWDQSIRVDGEHDENLVTALWNGICPGVMREATAFKVANGRLKGTDIGSPALAKWRNWWCDVHSAYAHIHGKRDLFVTTNVAGFQRNSRSLKVLGLTAVTPWEALTIVEE